MKNFLQKIHGKISKRKSLSIFLAAVILAAGYYAYGKFGGSSAPSQYVLAAVRKGTLVSSVSGTGQVDVSNQIDVNPKVSGDVVYVGVSEGQWVNAGAILAKLDSSDAEKAVRDARINLENANIDLEKLNQSSADPVKIQEDSFNSISSAFLDLPAIVSGAETIINGSTLSSNQSNEGYYQDFVYNNDRDQAALFVSAAENDYEAARSQYDAVLTVYKNTSRYADAAATSDLLDKTVDAAKSIAQALKSEQNLLDYLADYDSSHPEKILPALASSYRANLQNYIGQANSHLSDMIGVQNTVKNTPLDVASQKIAVQQKQNSLSDAEANLDDYVIRAPISGIVAKINVKTGDSASSGAAAATIITNQKIADISLNEVDVAKVKLGQKATLTFDAVPNLTISGEVAQIDAVGTVTQGVVDYAVQISFDTQDGRIKPGMSVSAAIVTDVRQNVLLAPNGAVKSQGGASYVEVPDAAENIGKNGVSGNAAMILKFTPKQQPVEIGASNDSMTEVTSGLNEGDLIVIRTVSASSASSAPAAGQTRSGGARMPGMFLGR